MNGNQNNQIENARFVQQMLGELRAMAKNSNMDMLAYLIEIAYIESSDELRKQMGSALPVRKRNVTS